MHPVGAGHVYASPRQAGAFVPGRHVLQLPDVEMPPPVPRAESQLSLQAQVGSACRLDSNTQLATPPGQVRRGFSQDAQPPFGSQESLPTNTTPSPFAYTSPESSVPPGQPTPPPPEQSQDTLPETLLELGDGPGALFEPSDGVHPSQNGDPTRRTLALEDGNAAAPKEQEALALPGLVDGSKQAEKEKVLALPDQVEPRKQDEPDDSESKEPPKDKKDKPAAPARASKALPGPRDREPTMYEDGTYWKLPGKLDPHTLTPFHVVI